MILSVLILKMDDLYLKLHHYTPGSKGDLLMSPHWSVMLHVTWSVLLAAALHLPGVQCSQPCAMFTALPALHMLRVT